MDSQEAQLTSTGRRADGVIARQPGGLDDPFWQPLHPPLTSRDRSTNELTFPQDQFSFCHSLDKIQVMGRYQNTDADLVELAEQVHNLLGQLWVQVSRWLIG